MKNKYLIYFVIILIFSSVFLGACKEKEEPKKEEDRKPPQSLEQVQELTEEIVNKTIEKDWATSIEKTKELHSKWNEFYPDVQKKGLPKEKTDEFNRDLNRLTDLLISKSLSIPQQKKDDKKKEEDKDKGQKEEGGKEEGKEDGSEEQGEEKKQEDDKEAKDEEDKEKDKEKDKDKEAKDEEKDKKDPKKVVEKEVPLVTVTAQELIIINASIEVTKHIPIFMSLFESEVPPDVLKLKYLVRHIDVSSKLQEWDIVSGDIEKALETWVYIQPKVIEVKDTLAIQIQQSLTELVQVIELKDSTLISIKSDVIIKNIEKVVEEFKKKAEEEQKK